MPRPRPRRRSYNARRTTRAQPYQPTSLAFYISATALNTITTTFFEPQTGLSVNGIPKFFNASIGYMPTAVEILDQTNVRYTYPINVGTSDILTLGGNDPGLRNQSGAFLPAGTYLTGTPPPPDGIIPWTATLFDANHIDVNLTPGPYNPAQVCPGSGGNFQNQTTGENTSDYALINNLILRVHFPTIGVSSGDAIDAQNPEVIVTTFNRGLIAGGIQIVT